MNYTYSIDYVTHAGTGQRMHTDTAAIPTVWSAADANSVMWSLSEVVKAAGMQGGQFNADDPGSYSVFLNALRALFLSDADLLCQFIDLAIAIQAVHNEQLTQRFELNEIQKRGIL